MANRKTTRPLSRRANGSGSITARSDGALILRVTRSDGSRAKRIVRRVHREDGVLETPSQHWRRAERVLEEFSSELQAAPQLSERWTVDRWARERYLPSLVDSRKPNTVESYRRVLDTLLAPIIGDIELRALTVHHVDLLDQRLRDRGLSVVSRRHARGLLSRILKHARAKGVVTADVTGDADKIRAPRPDRSGAALESEEVSVLLTAAKGTIWETPFALLALLGLRRGELLGLSWESVNLEESSITIERNLVTLGGGRLVLGSPKTASGRRTLHLSDRLVALLRIHRRNQAAMALAAGPHWIRGFEDQDGAQVALVFTDEVGRPLPGHRVNSALERIAKKAGLSHVNPHRLRHSAASLMIDSGMNPAAVGDVLGHASPAVTMSVYAHALARASVVATDSIAAAVGEW